MARKPNPDYSFAYIKGRAAGRWTEILSALAHVGASYLTGRHGPCPKCGDRPGGGADRWRWTNLDDGGGGICNQCGKFGDGFALLQSLCGWDSKETLRRVAEHLGCQGGGNSGAGTGRNGKASIDPAKDLRFDAAINSMLAAHFCRAKPPITLDALIRCHARQALYRGQYKVIAVPVWGEKLTSAEPVGWALYDIRGGTLPRWDQDKTTGEWKIVERLKVKLTKGSTEPGWLGPVEDLAAATHAWKVEGVTDLLAFYSLESIAAGHIAVTNAFGAGETPRPWMLETLAGKTVYTIHDADIPGRNGAMGYTDEKDEWHPGWGNWIASRAAESLVVELPYPIEPTKGKDLRDFAQDRVDVFAELLRLAEVAPEVPAAELTQSAATETDSGPAPITNAEVEYHEDEDGKEKPKIVALDMSEIIKRIFVATDGWPKRVGNSLFIHEPQGIHWIESAPALFGWLSSRLGAIEWRRSVGCATKEELFHELCRTAESFEAIESLPHFPPMPGHYYACPKYEPGDGSHLDKLVNFFSPETPQDRMLILAMFATPFWGGKPGSRPAFLVTSDKGRGVGKSTIAAMIARLAGGFIELRATEDASRMYARLLSPNGLKLRIARLDNVKTLKFSWAELEAVITSPSISGHRLHKGEASRPNSLSLFITLNGASLSIDMAQRVIIVKLAKPRGRMGAWESDVCDFIDNHRQEILADIAAFFELEPEPIPDHTRWAAWEDEVLGRLVDSMKIKKLIETRANQANVESEEIERMEEFIEERLRDLKYQSCLIHIPSGVAAEWYCQVTGERKGPIAIGRIITQACNEGHAKKMRPNPNRSHGRGFVFSLAEDFSGDRLQELISRENFEPDIFYDLENRIQGKIFL